MEKFEGIGIANLLAYKQTLDFMYKKADDLELKGKLLKLSIEITEELETRVLALI